MSDTLYTPPKSNPEIVITTPRKCYFFTAINSRGTVKNDVAMFPAFFNFKEVYSRYPGYQITFLKEIEFNEYICFMEHVAEQQKVKKNG